MQKRSLSFIIALLYSYIYIFKFWRTVPEYEFSLKIVCNFNQIPECHVGPEKEKIIVTYPEQVNN